LTFWKARFSQEEVGESSSVKSMLRIGSLTLKNPYIMAPMAGITNRPFRLMVKEFGAAMVTSEMVSAAGLMMGQNKTLDYLRSDFEERPFCVQLFGSEPDVMSKAAEKVIRAGADAIDINMGCPARKVVKTGSGGALLLDWRKAERIVRAVRRVSPLPLTVKIRAGWSPTQSNPLDLAPALEDGGADAVTVHPRFVTQGFSGIPNWGLIAQIKSRVRVPVIGNGDVFSPFLAVKIQEETGCDGVMIARGALGKPWIFRQILDLAHGRIPFEPEPLERKCLIMKHYQLLSNEMGERRAAYHFRGLLLRYTKGLARSGRFRRSIEQVKDLQSLVAAMDDYFSSMEAIDP
jgi:tRNA-dihydrouridine synthase B